MALEDASGRSAAVMHSDLPKNEPRNRNPANGGLDPVQAIGLAETCLTTVKIRLSVAPLVGEDRWEVWDIALQDFVDANDVNLAGIKKFTIGIGDGMMRIYNDGLLVAQNTEAFLPMSGAGAVPSRIGSAVDDTGRANRKKT